jgi:hypothetical protein
MDKEKKRRQGGAATTDLVLSSHVGGNAAVFAQLLALHGRDGMSVADVTWGRGAFWRSVDPSRYRLFPSDIKDGVDCRALPYADGAMDMVVFDPPYIEGFHRRAGAEPAGGGSHAAFRERYSDGGVGGGARKYHDAVLMLYLEAAVEARRVLSDGGTYVVKCQDEVSANRQRLTHVELVYLYERLGFYCKDVFVVTRTNRPGVSRLLRQAHARKNHSYFLVLVKGGVRHSSFRDDLLAAVGG